MKLLEIFFGEKKDGQIQELQSKIGELEEKILAGDLNQSLMAFDGNNVIYWDTDKVAKMGSHPALYRGIDMLADMGSQLPYKIYRGETEVPIERPLGNGFILEEPHPKMSFNEVLYVGLVHFYYSGELMIRIHKDPFFYLEPVNPKKMERYPDDSAWKLTKTKGGTERIEDDELIYARWFNPDGTRGLSPVDVVKNDILNDKEAIKYNTEFFKNFGQVGGFLYDELGKARLEDIKKVVDQFDIVHSGSKKAYKTLGLPGGIKYQEFAQTMREMQYLESRRDIRDRILSVLGIHKALFGVTDQVNRSVAEEATRQIWLQTIKPKMIRIQEKFNQCLFRNYFPGYSMEFDFSGVQELKESAETILNQAKIYRELGYTLNEINEKFELGMEVVTDPIGNMRLIPSNFVPADDLSVSLDDIKETPAGEKKDLTDFFDKEPEDTLGKSITIYNRGYNRIRRKYQKQFQGKMSKFWAKELNQVIRIVLNQKSVKVSGVDTNTLLSEVQNFLEQNKDELVKQLKPVYESASKNADQLASLAVGGTADPVANERVVGNLVNEIRGISNHTYRRIRTQVKDGVNAGETIDQIADRIKSLYKDSTSVRSKIIARTETANVIHRTANERYKEEGVQKKKWISTNDSDTRSTHRSNDSSGVVPYDHIYSNGQKFPNDGRGGAAENVNCRCSFIGVK